jgi:type II secretory pathway pseudopilin PulG
VALLIVLLAIVLASGYVGLRGLNAAYAKPERDARTMAALQQAKQALLGYAANRVRQGPLGSIDVTGALPCPALNLQGLPANQWGLARATCSPTTQRLGRLPWQTLELPELTDAAGEGLWYAVSVNFRHVADPNPVTPTPRVNAHTRGQIRLSADGVITQSRIVAVIVAPGPVVAGQQRGAGTVAGDTPGNYLERYTVGPVVGVDFDFHVGRPTNEPPFNDTLVTITEAELFDAIEGGLARRIQEYVVPRLADHFKFYGALPFATGSFDPLQPSAAMSGIAGQTTGHLPVAQQTPLYSGAAKLSGAAGVNCTGPMSTSLPAAELVCEVTGASAGFVIEATLTNVNAGVFRPPVVNVFGGVASASIIAQPITGSTDATIRISGALASGSTSAFISVAAPQQVLNAADPLAQPDAQWFMYPQWAKFVYYARCSDSSVACLTLNDMNGATVPARAALVLAGRPVQKANTWMQDQSATAPSPIVNEYLEAPNNAVGTTVFQRGTRTAAFNDRVVAVP